MILFLRAHNLVHAKISVRASCAHDRHRTRNLSSPVIEIFTTALLLTTAYCRALSLKNTIHLKFAWHSKRQKENIEKKKKNEKWEKSNSNNNCFYFYFFLLKNSHFVYFVSKYIWNAVIKHETRADAVIQPRILSKNLGRQKEEDKKVVLGNRLGIWADFQSNWWETRD